MRGWCGLGVVSDVLAVRDTGLKDGRVKDISDELMAQARAKVASSPPPVRTTSDRAGGGDTYDERPPVWDEIERIVGYRVTDENQEQAFLDASNSPLDRLYDHHMKAPRACTCGSSVCTGARSPCHGHVLGGRWLESADPPAARRGSHR